MKINKNFVIERYKNKERLNKYISKVKEGFFPEEKILIKRYIKPESKILVVGCGTGREVFGLKKLGFNNIMGIDISPDMIQEAKKLLPGIRFYVSDITDYRLKEKFDALLYFNNILEQIPSPENRKKAILKAKFLLKEGGVSIFTTHSRFVLRSYGFELVRSLLGGNSPFDYINKKEKIYAHYSNPFTIKKILRLNGFKIIEINSRKNIIKKQKPRFFYIFDEPIYYICKLK